MDHSTQATRPEGDKHMTNIFVMDEQSGKIMIKATYSLDPKRAIIAYIMQSRSNWNTWEYPEDIAGIRESTKAANHFYYDDIKHNLIIAAYPE
jgi:hypothetical protein